MCTASHINCSAAMKLRWRWQALMLEAQRSVLPTRNLYKSAAEHLSFAYEQVGACPLCNSTAAVLCVLPTDCADSATGRQQRSTV